MSTSRSLAAQTPVHAACGSFEEQHLNADALRLAFKQPFDTSIGRGMSEHGDFWEVYRQLADCYRADLARLGGASPVEKREEGRQSEEEMARAQGHRLQRVLLARMGFLAEREEYYSIMIMMFFFVV